jgi:uncharacterized membrane protein
MDWCLWFRVTGGGGSFVRKVLLLLLVLLLSLLLGGIPLQKMALHVLPIVLAADSICRIVMVLVLFLIWTLLFPQLDGWWVCRKRWDNGVSLYGRLLFVVVVVVVVVVIVAGFLMFLKNQQLQLKSQDDSGQEQRDKAQKGHNKQFRRGKGDRHGWDIQFMIL